LDCKIGQTPEKGVHEVPSGKKKATWKELVVKPLMEHLPSLYPVEEWDPLMDIRIGRLAMEQLTGGGPEQEPYGLACKAGLYLFNENLDKSHEISQHITNDTGSYWHGIMHRMEGDYSNAKYWFHDVAHHPIHTDLIGQVKDYLTRQEEYQGLEHETLKAKLDVLIHSPEWNASVFTDVVELQVTLVQHPIADIWLRHIQRMEMRLLWQYAYMQSGGGQ
jgi:hypothetical protein